MQEERFAERMIFELAPLEGITTYIYRNAYAHHFGKVDRYYTPFLSLHKEKEFNHKEKQEISPLNNEGIRVIPQVLTNSSEDFLRAAKKLKDLGYGEINLNAGCPSGTVTTKAKGAGMLEDPMRLDKFLSEIFEKSEVKISIKTRLGMEKPEEWEDLLKIYNKYPLEKLIVHARVREDFYKNSPNWEAFGMALKESKNPVCYNGDIFTVEDYFRLQDTFPELESVMLGRGVIANPGLVTQIKEAEANRAVEAGKSGLVTGDYQRLQAFHDEVYAGYQAIQFGDRNILFKMKELWHYMVHSFPDAAKHEKKLRKINSCAEYESYVKAMFRGVQ